ncbi:putative ribonuclease H-like domain-containing protein [Tanacetum coccineum]|uniref:Ribonuclease H-like domain-containing protein n=1 Tax=Tanacetum coccineum TaxID=301880 RepID=A0ABQ4WWP0_9ASTR
MGPFPKSLKFEYLLVGVDHVSKWAKAQALPTNDARVVITFLKKLFYRFRMPKALISDRGGSPAGIHGLFSGWYCGLASRKVTLGVSMAWAKGVTTGTLCALSLDKLTMPPHLHKKFRMGVAIAKVCSGYYKPGTRAWVRRSTHKIRIPIDMYPCRVEERLTIKLIKGEEEEEEIFKLKAIYENVIYDISDSDSDLESMARSGPRDSEMEDTGVAALSTKYEGKEKQPRNERGSSKFKNQDNTRKQGNNEDTSSKAMLAIDGVGFDWSDIAEERVQTNMALIVFSDSEVYNDKTCSKTCLNNYETLKKQCDDLIVKLNQTEFIAATYKRGLATVEEQLITYRKNEVLFSEEVVVLKKEVACKDYEINVLKSLFEKVKQEKEGIEFKIEKFDKASKDLDKLLGSQITDKSKKGLGYNVVPPPYPLIYNRPKKLDLSYSCLDEFKEPEFKAYGSEDSNQKSNVVYDKKSDDSKENSDDSLVKKQVSKESSSFVESSLNVDKETVFPVDKKVEFVKPKNHEKPVKKSVRYAEMYRSQTPRGNQRNWNGQKSNQLGSDFVMYNKACFICGSFDHVQAHCKYHQRERMVYGNNYNRVNYNYTTKRTHPNAQRNMVPRAVLMKTGLKTFNTARTVNTAHPKSTVFSAKPMPRFSKIAQSTVRRPFQPKTVLTNKRFTQKVNTAKAQAVNTARPKAVKTARPNSAVVNAVRGEGQQEDTGFVDRLPDESQILLKIPRKDNMYSFDMKNIVPKESLTCLVAKATLDESML